MQSMEICGVMRMELRHTCMYVRGYWQLVRLLVCVVALHSVVQISALSEQVRCVAFLG